MNKKTLLVLTASILSMNIASCGHHVSRPSEESVPISSEQTPVSSEVLPSSEPTSSSETTTSSVAPVSSEQTPSSVPSSSSTPVSSSELPVRSSETPISSSEAPISSSEAPSSSEEPPVEQPINIVVNLPSYTDSSKTYDLTFTYHSSMFDHDQNRFSKDLALLAFGNAVSNQSEEMIEKFYTDAGCDSIELHEYDFDPTSDSIAYAFAHKKLADHDLVFASIRGFNYGQEWEDNFNVGTEGEHLGFINKANAIRGALEIYFLNNNCARNVILFINGYSRGGAVANLLAKEADNYFVGFPCSSIFAYTFEAPKGGLIEDNSHVFNNIFNIVSSGDLITHFAPEQYGFTRYGQDIDVYRGNLDQLVEEFDPDLEFPPFVATDYYANEEQLINYLIEGVISYDQSDDTQPREAKTREQFVDNYADAFGYMLGLFFCLKGETTAAIKEGLAALSNDFMAMAGLMYYEDGLYNFLKPYIDEDGIAYDDDSFKESCKVLIEFLKGPGTRALAILIDTNKTLDRMLMLHTPEINYVLLKNYNIYL